MQKIKKKKSKAYKYRRSFKGMENIFVSDIMTRDPITISPDTDLLECAKKMVSKNVGSLLIVAKKHLVGIITDQDILWALTKKSQKDLKEIKAIDISPKKIATIKPTASVKEALSKMKKLKFERLPVIHDGNLVGMLTAKDILNFKPEYFPELEEYAEIREQSMKLKRIKSKEPIEGICEECGTSDLLYRLNGMLICENCREGM